MEEQLEAAYLEANQEIEPAWKTTTGDGLEDEDWSSIDDTQYLMSIPGMVETILEAAKQPVEECRSWETLKHGNWQIQMNSTLYDRDFHQWIETTIGYLKQRKFDLVD